MFTLPGPGNLYIDNQGTQGFLYTPGNNFESFSFRNPTTGQAWSGARGRLNRDALAELVHDPATLCFDCGPPALVDEMPKILTDLGIPRQRIKIEEW